MQNCFYIERDLSIKPNRISVGVAGGDARHKIKVGLDEKPYVIDKCYKTEESIKCNFNNDFSSVEFTKLKDDKIGFNVNHKNAKFDGVVDEVFRSNKKILTGNGYGDDIIEFVNKKN